MPASSCLSISINTIVFTIHSTIQRARFHLSLLLADLAYSRRLSILLLASIASSAGQWGINRAKYATCLRVCADEMEDELIDSTGSDEHSIGSVEISNMFGTQAIFLLKQHSLTEYTAANNMDYNTWHMRHVFYFWYAHIYGPCVLWKAIREFIPCLWISTNAVMEIHKSAIRLWRSISTILYGYPQMKLNKLPNGIP